MSSNARQLVHTAGKRSQGEACCFHPAQPAKGSQSSCDDPCPSCVTWSGLADTAAVDHALHPEQPVLTPQQLLCTLGSQLGNGKRCSGCRCLL